MEIRDWTRGAVIHIHARRVDDLVDRQRRARCHRTETGGIHAQSMRVEAMRCAGVVRHRDGHLVAFARLNGRRRQMSVVRPCLEPHAHAEIDGGLTRLERKRLVPRSRAGLLLPRESRHAFRLQLGRSAACAR